MIRIINLYNLLDYAISIYRSRSVCRDRAGWHCASRNRGAFSGDEFFDRLMNFSSGQKMQSSCLVKYTTRSLYIRTLAYIRCIRGAPPPPTSPFRVAVWFPPWFTKGIVHHFQKSRKKRGTSPPLRGTMSGNAAILFANDPRGPATAEKYRREIEFATARCGELAIFRLD